MIKSGWEIFNFISNKFAVDATALYLIFAKFDNARPLLFSVF